MRRARRWTLATIALGALAVAAPAAEASAPGWSTPHAISTYTVGTFAAGPNGQSVMLFGTGAAQSRAAQMRAIRTDGSQRTARPIDVPIAGIDGPSVSMNADQQLVAAWMLDTQGPGPIGIAAALGTRPNLPQSGSVLPTTGSVEDVATAITSTGVALVAWIEGTPSAQLVRAATLRPGQAPQVVGLTSRSDANLTNVSAGFDSSGRPTVTWAVDPAATGLTLTIGSARGDGSGAFAAAVEDGMATTQLNGLQTFTTSTGRMIALWFDGTVGAGNQYAVKTAEAPPGGRFGATQTLTSGTQGGAPAFAANAAGRAAVILPTASGQDSRLRVVLRTSGGTWGTARTVGASGRYVSRAGIGVDSKGRVVALWDDGPSRSAGTNRILAARSSGSTDPLGSPHQLTQRSNDRRCASPSLYVATTGDGLGRWNCSTSSSGSINGPRLARLTKAS